MWLKAGFILIIFISCGLIFSCSLRKETVDLDNEAVSEEMKVSGFSDIDYGDDTAAETEQETICVYVCGNVKAPGIYYLDEGSRLFEAIDKAGGLNEEASDEALNLAENISDGMRIYVPSTDEVNADINIGFSDTSEKQININTASADELKSLSGIGDTRAEAIIQYREKEGAFKTIEDLMNVSGIGKASFDKLKDHIRV